MSTELDAYQRLQALAASRLGGVPDPAMARVLERMKTAIIRETLKCIAAIERLPTAKDSEQALEQAAKRASQLEFLRALIDELGVPLQ